MKRATQPFCSKRPSVDKRKFNSSAVEELITEVTDKIGDPELAWMFRNCYPNTLDTTVEIADFSKKRADSFVITGDIPALWLRDSTAQVWPYMPLLKSDKHLAKLIQGLIHRHARCVLLDPYANSFEQNPAHSGWATDSPTPKPGVHECKWEIDSLCYVIRLAFEYYRITNDKSVFDTQWDKAMRLIVSTFITEQRKDGSSPYSFVRQTAFMLDAPPFYGKGNPLRPVGMIASMFRPSDDSTIFPFLVPSNLFAVQELRHLAIIYSTVFTDKRFAQKCTALAEEVESAIKKYAVVNHSEFGKIYAYEVDGYGNYVCMDDANVPSLMSLPYLGICKSTDPLYRRTRAFLLSDSNPYYLRGTAADGQASPHTGFENIWPMGIILRALTSTDDDEITHCLSLLKKTHADTGFMHESFHKNDPCKFSRSWFAWANTLFGELIIKVYTERPKLLA